MTEARHGPLHGVRILEFSLIFSAPYAGIHLADLGADVIKVEQPGGEPFRHMTTRVPGHSKTFQSVNRGKRSLVLDLHRPEAREVVARLVPNVDVVLINYRRGVAARLGIDYETLSALHPGLIYAEITGFSPEGPNRAKAASDMVAQGYGGSIALDAKIDEMGAPVWPSIAVGDFPSGLAAVIGITSALYHRERTGEGQYLSVSLLRAVMAMTCYINNVEPVNDASGRDLIKAELDRVRAEGGSYRDLIAVREGGTRTGTPMSLYWTGYVAADGGIVLGALTKANRDAIRSVLGIEDPTDDEGWDASEPANQERVDRIKEQIAAKIRERPVQDWIDRFEEAGAPVAPVVLPEDLPDHPEGTLHYSDLVHEVTGPQRFVGPIVQMEASPTAIPSAAPLVGQHTDSVLSELGGYGPDEIAALRSLQAIE